MYNEYFGLQRHPFNMTPDPGSLFLTEQHKEALAGLGYAILDRKGFVLLTGDAGTGKTTLLARVLQYLPAQRIWSSVILNSMLTPPEFLEMVMLDFGFTDIPSSKALRIHQLQKFLLEAREKGKIAMLAVDEAQKLSPEVLEEIRLLGNFESDQEKLLQIVLIGQNELNDVLNREELRQLKQRIAIRLAIARLQTSDVTRYLNHRWAKAGGQLPGPFSDAAIEQIENYSRGIPRLVNALCDNALTIAYAKAAKVVSVAYVQEAARDLDLVPALVPKPATAIQTPSQLEGLPHLVSAAPLMRLQMLERYGGVCDQQPSFWSRWAARLGLA
jgi:general secretion pathway protein A